jgi:RNA polymerase sigma factor (sigma-70 family)
MKAAREEREERFAALFDANLADIVAYCGWRAATAADAQDAVSETFLTAWRRLDEVPSGDAARPWLYVTARRVLANQARSERRRTRLHARLCLFTEPEPSTGLAGEDAARQPDAAVRSALEAMTADDQEILLLAEWEGLSAAEIGKVLGCPAVTARGRLFRARRRFRGAYESAACETRADPAGAEACSLMSTGPITMTTTRGVVE